jgi:branched-chain amino acid transport system ATP-binding protein
MAFAVRDLCYRHLTGAGFEQISFELSDGQRLGVTGVNGSGKTTLLNVISGFIQATQGEILLDGARLNEAKPWERALRGVERSWQIASPIPLLTLEEYCRARLMWQPKSSYLRAVELLAVLGVSLRAEVEALSGGERRAADIAIALSRKARVLLLDEPFAGIDVNKVQVVIEWLFQIADRAIVLVDHDLERLKTLCGRRVLMIK